MTATDQQDAIVTALFRLWGQHPDLRFVQLLHWVLAGQPKGISGDWFYLPDGNVLAALHARLAETKP